MGSSVSLCQLTNSPRTVHVHFVFLADLLGRKLGGTNLSKWGQEMCGWPPGNFYIVIETCLVTLVMLIMCLVDVTQLFPGKLL